VRRVLDCACGTGHHLVLRSLGCDLVGSDISEARLTRARANLAARGAEVTLHADCRDLAWRAREPFDAVLRLSTSILQVPGEPEVLRALQNMRAVLRPGGLHVLTQGTTDPAWREKPRFLFAADRPGVTRIFVFEYLSERAARCASSRPVSAPSISTARSPWSRTTSASVAGGSRSPTTGRRSRCAGPSPRRC
jgi:SAM-dependent methyltransferase